MTVNQNQDRFFGKPVVEFRMGHTIADPASVRTTVYRLTQDYDSDESQHELLEAFLTQIDTSSLDALVIGAWSEAHDESPQEYLDMLIERRGELGALRALFIGDMTYEDCEISWIIQCGGYNALLDAFPMLQVLRIRGSTQLELKPIAHEFLEEFAVECGGLPSAIVDAIAGSTLPALRRLELWLGDDNYGFDGGIDTYEKLLAAIKPERLEYLGLRNAQISDALAVHLAKQPWLGQVKTLDLSMGTIGDEGAQALLDSPHLNGLQTLDLSHHYIGDDLQKKLKSLPCRVVLDDPQDAEETDGDRYVEVAE
ncbi:MAG: STM4015 family protein [Xanthomonadaceae bacterium]|nr:STM4015 family protein [Xanthomonadaceae bacterium]